jgi:hypothetical protein
MAVINLTEARIRELEPGSGIWRDEQVKGLMVVCHATTKTYAVQRDVRRNCRHIRTVRVKIDRVDRIGLREARNKAKAIMSQIQSGIDPTAKPEESGITVAQALEAHLDEKAFREATIESYRYNIEHYPARYKNRAITDLGRAEVRDIYERLRETKGPQPASPRSLRPEPAASRSRRSRKSCGRCWKHSAITLGSTPRRLPVSSARSRTR